MCNILSETFWADVIGLNAVVVLSKDCTQRVTFSYEETGRCPSLEAVFYSMELDNN
jgi:hypothetical protein